MGGNQGKHVRGSFSATKLIENGQKIQMNGAVCIINTFIIKAKNYINSWINKHTYINVQQSTQVKNLSAISHLHQKI